ncbi:polyphosphate kinase 1 [Winogradskyella luteola]|uniref:Polyphosphate kinase n=1 Tax=Winogradskyella luteola TaxID=2828330 RepID=A0A9X1FBD0_9FLAO|nr:polyphosphate kinase 1 [Winogradskyella luteola]MBV7269525.1 polyphosphate kinase 1 [Winogradskyella luteola]
MSQKRYINRDISWLSFNERVLQEAEDPINSLNQRLKFLAIFSSNLDEFYRVRVSKLRQFRSLRKDSPIRLKEKPKKIVKRIQKIVDRLQNKFGYIYKEKLLKELAAEGVVLIEASQFSDTQHQISKEVFESTVKEHISIYDLDDQQNFDFIKDKGLFFFLNNEDRALLVSIPSETCGRFITLQAHKSKTYITFLDEVIRNNITQILPNFDSKNLFSVKITRDGELYYEEEENGELIKLIKESLKERDLGMPTRILYDVAMPKQSIKALRKKMKLKKTDLMPGGKFHNFSDFFSFPDIENRISVESVDEIPHQNLANTDSVIETVKEQDQLLCFPYHQYSSVLKLIEEASTNDSVTHIYITLYRISKNSSVARGLINCLARGKKVTVFVEAKARFDEENNIEWGEKLAKLGANVLYSMVDLKVHSKIMLIKTDHCNISYVGTGNFNEKSAKIYADFTLLTADKTITKDLEEVFKFLLDTSYEPNINSIWMSPFTTRKELYLRIDNEIAIAKQGGDGYLFFKMNSLEDKGIIDKLYEASNAGVRIRLLVRGICCLIPGIKNMSENIKIISIVGKYLEHARVYIFGNKGSNDIFIGSADCMERNLDRRVEVLVPIANQKIKRTIEMCLSLQWHDNVKGRIVDAKQTNSYQKNGESKINSQEDFRKYLNAEHYQLEPR